MAKTNTPNTAIEKRPEAAGTVSVPDRQEQAATWYTPLVDVIENGDGFVFQADLPGVKAGDVEVSFENGTLTLEAKAAPRQPAGRSYLWREYGVGHFYRSFNIAAPINADGIKAQLKDGVLELYVPKAESARPRKVQIQAD
jgi:HSP20 family molecular chaperone IbpA